MGNLLRTAIVMGIYRPGKVELLETPHEVP
jgi:hypothetical protein